MPLSIFFHGGKSVRSTVPLCTDLMVATGIIIKMYLEAILNTDLHQDSILAAIPSHPSSDVTDLFTCNLPPSDATRSAILAKIQQYEHFIFLVNSYGHHVDVKRQSSIILERAKAKNLIVSLRSIVHPIRFVPDDVLLGIFAVVVDTTCASSVATDTDLWVCSRVCQRWRTLVLCAPSLWADVRLDFDDDVYLRYRLSRAERILTERLERSGNNLLDVYVRGTRADPDTNTVLSRLLTSATRWRSLTVDAGPEVYELFENCPGGSLSELRTLSITDSVFMDGDIDEEDRYVGVVIEAFSFTPNLRRLFISPLPLTSLSLSAKTLHNGIEEFSVSLFDQAVDVSRLLPTMQALMSLDILCDAVWEGHSGMVCLPLVSRITLRDYNDTRRILDVWDRLYLPNITSLRLSYEGLVLHPKFPPFDRPNLRVTEFACHINSFADFEIPDFESDLIAMLRSLPNITNLRLSSCRTTPILLEAMRSDTRFLSALTDLTLVSNVPASGFPDAYLFLLIDTLYTRATSVACATVKYLAFADEVILYEGPTPYTAMWDELINGGLEAVETRDALF